MTEKTNYNINLDVKYKPLELIDIPEIVQYCTEKWFNQTLTKVNDSVVRLGIVEGEFHWHKHDEDDEFFFVIEGKLIIEIEDRRFFDSAQNDNGSSFDSAQNDIRTIELNPNQGVTIPKGVLHKPYAPKKTIMLMVETSEIKPTGD